MAWFDDLNKSVGGGTPTRIAGDAPSTGTGSNWAARLNEGVQQITPPSVRSFQAPQEAPQIEQPSQIEAPQIQQPQQQGFLGRLRGGAQRVGEGLKSLGQRVTSNLGLASEFVPSGQEAIESVQDVATGRRDLQSEVDEFSKEADSIKSPFLRYAAFVGLGQLRGGAGLLQGGLQTGSGVAEAVREGDVKPLARAGLGALQTAGGVFRLTGAGQAIALGEGAISGAIKGAREGKGPVGSAFKGVAQDTLTSEALGITNPYAALAVDLASGVFTGRVGTAGARGLSRISKLATNPKRFKTAQGFVKAQPKVFHGTTRDFKKFDSSRLGEATGSKTAKAGFWFTDDADTANSYSKAENEKRVGELLEQGKRKAAEQLENNIFANRDSRVLKEVTLELENPKIIDVKKDGVGQRYNDAKEEINKAIAIAKRNGNDGLIVKNLSDHADFSVFKPATHTLVFDAKNIKTKDQLVDTFNKAKKSLSLGFVEEDISTKQIQSKISRKTPLDRLSESFERGRKAHDPDVATKGVKSLLQRGRKAFRREVTDKFADVEDFTKLAGKELTTEQNPYKRFRLLAGVGGKTEAIVKSEIEPILRGLTKGVSKKVGAEKIEDFSRLLAVERTIEKGGQGYKTLLSADEAREGLELLAKKYGEDGLRTLQKSAQEYRRVHTKVLRRLAQSGIISEDSLKSITAKNQFYVPFEIVDFMAENAEKGKFGKSSFNVASQDVIKSFKGSEREIADPIEASVKQLSRSIPLIERNEAMKSLVDLRKLEPETYGKLITEHKGGRIPKDAGSVNVFINGENKTFLVPKEIEEAVKHLNKKQIGVLGKIANPFANVLRSGATVLNPAFILANMPKDTLDAVFGRAVQGGAEKAAKFLSQYPGALADVVFKKGDYIKWLKSGGAQSAFLSSEVFKTPQKTVRELAGLKPKGAKAKFAKVVKSPLEALQFLGRVSEETTRVARFKEGLKAGESLKTAALASRDITLDFSRSGNTMQVLNRAIPFLNAATQGSAKMLSLFKDNPGKAAVTMSAMVGMPTAMMYMNNRKFDDYKDLAQFEKDNNFIIMLRDRTPEEKSKREPLRALKIPKGNILKPFSNLLENYYQFVDSNDPKALNELALDIAEDVSPIGVPVGKDRARRFVGQTIPQALKPGVEIATGKNLFTGRDIVPRTLQGVEPTEQFTERTPETAVKLGQATGTSPVQIENLARTVGAGVGRQILEPKRAVTDIKRRFFGPRGGEETEKQFQELGEIETQDKTERLKAERVLKRAITSGDISGTFSEAKRKGELTQIGFDHISDEEKIAKTMFDEVNKLSGDKQREFLRTQEGSGMLTQGVYDEMVKLQDLGAFERSLKGKRTSVRATSIKGKLDALTTDQEKNEFLQDLEEKKILTKAVFEELRVL